MKVQAILYPWAFIEDADGKIIGRFDVDREFNDQPYKDASVEKNDNGKWDVTGNNTDDNCVNGVCPIK